nr:hypothetical protein BaRGS_019826 [Batillaria attramentaria]
MLNFQDDMLNFQDDMLNFQDDMLNLPVRTRGHPDTRYDVAYLTDTSKTLFRATRNQLYFREFVIVIPETWKGLDYYENALDVQLDRAQIIIDHANPAYGDAPYVKQYAECGQPGLYIHLTPSYLLDDDVIHKWGQPEKTLVHEWAHLRWGLFDEYPIDSQDAEFYRYNGAWQPTRCSTEVEGSILNELTSKQCSFDYFTGKPEKTCRFFPRMKSNQAVASLMFMQYLESIVEFCDDPATAARPMRHNYLAPNRQNRLCAYRSSWEVMRKHDDFRKARLPLPDSTDTTPVFRYVQVQPRKRALVLDTSGSMTGSSLSVMMRAASNYILSCVETGSKLGIVQFNTNATALSPLQQINTETDRQDLIKSLPRQADGKTSIGAGLEKGLQLVTEARSVFNNTPWSGSFTMDSTLGVDTSLTLSYSKPINVTLTGPGDVIITRDTHPDQFKLDDDSGVIKIIIPRVASVGRWQYYVTTNESQSDVVISVQSKPRQADGDVIQIASWLPEDNSITFDPKQKLAVFAEVTKGRAPVLGADVIAVVERPQSASLTIPLYDSGMGSDVIKDDGVYAAYVLARDLMGDGRYNIKIRVQGQAGSTKVVVGGRGRASMALDVTASGARQDLVTETVEQFQRVTTAGEFRVNGFPETKDPVPDLMAPSRITDLRVNNFDLDNAARYTLHLATDFEQLVRSGVNESVWSETDVRVQESLLHPQPAGTSESLTLSLSHLGPNDTVFLSVRAVDESGNAVATLILFLGMIAVVMISRRRNKMAETLEPDSALSASTFSLDLSHMNYRYGSSMEARVGLSASACLYCWYLVLTVVRAACPDNALEKAMKCTAGLGLGPPTPYNAFVETGQVEVAKQACRDRKLLNAIDCLDDIMAACQGNSDQEHFLRTMVDVDKSRACVQFFCSHLDEYEMHAECIATNHPALTRCVETERRNMQTKVKATGNMDFLIMATCK